MNDETNIQKFGTWEVLPTGDMLESSTDFFIHAERLLEGDWIREAITQGWDLNAFVPAWYYSVTLQGIKEINMIIAYE
jgi:hypothetical protein